MPFLFQRNQDGRLSYFIGHILKEIQAFALNRFGLDTDNIVQPPHKMTGQQLHIGHAVQLCPYFFGKRVCIEMCPSKIVGRRDHNKEKQTTTNTGKQLGSMFWFPFAGKSVEKQRYQVIIIVLDTPIGHPRAQQKQQAPYKPKPTLCKRHAVTGIKCAKEEHKRQYIDGKSQWCKKMELTEIDNRQAQ
ncbi:MAG TPA: hypothetical protein DF610_09150 [Sphingobacterium sp.]|nr:hypothetical protein [Sphingobacterium sp.]